MKQGMVIDDTVQKELAQREWRPIPDSVLNADKVKAEKMRISLQDLKRYEHIHGAIVAGSDNTPMKYDHSKDGPGSLVPLYSGRCP